MGGAQAEPGFGGAEHHQRLPVGPTTRRVRRAEPGDAAACVGIVAGLPEFFTPDVVDKVRADLVAHDSWVLVEDGAVAAFAIVARRGRRRQAVAEVLWAATSAAHRNRGIGTALIQHVVDELDFDIRLVEVKTLDPSAGYEPYLATYGFWTSRGFVHVDTIDPFPGWEPGNPCAILIAAIDGTL